MSKDILLVNDPTSEYDHDLDFSNFGLQMVESTDYRAQKLRIRLWFFFNEWFLDTSKGIRFYDIIHVKNPDIALIDSTIKATILAQDGIIRLLEYESTYDPAARTYSVSFKALDIEGNTIIFEELLL